MYNCNPIKIRIALFILLWISLNFCKQDLKETRHAAVVTHISGEVLKKTILDKKQPLSLKIGDLLFETDTVQTMAGSVLHLQLNSDIIIKIGENSIIDIASLQQAGSQTNIKLTIVNGSVFAKIGKLTKNSVFRVASSSLTAGVRGTEFAFIFDREKNSAKVSVNDGKVEVTDRNGDAIFLDEGEEAVLEEKKTLEKKEISEEKREELKKQFDLNQIKKENYKRIEEIIHSNKDLKEKSSNKEGVEHLRKINKQLIEEIKQENQNLNTEQKQQDQKNIDSVKDASKNKVDDAKKKNQELIDRIKQKK